MPVLVKKENFIDDFFMIERRKAMKNLPENASTGEFMEMMYRMMLTDAAHIIRTNHKLCGEGDDG